MTIEEVKGYLLQIEKIDELIRNKRGEIKHWQEVAENITSSPVNVIVTDEEGEKQVVGMERVQSSKVGNKMEEAICEYMSIETYLSDMTSILATVRQGIIETIEQLKTNEYKLLYEIYVKRTPLTDVGYQFTPIKQYSTVTTLHSNALRSLQKLLNEREVKNEKSKKAEKE